MLFVSMQPQKLIIKSWSNMFQLIYPELAPEIHAFTCNFSALFICNKNHGMYLWNLHQLIFITDHGKSFCPAGWQH